MLGFDFVRHENYSRQDNGKGKKLNDAIFDGSFSEKRPGVSWPLTFAL